MSAVNLRLAESLLDLAKTRARKDGVSINRLVATALQEKLAALADADSFATRARRGSRAKLRAVLAKVPDAEPAPGDEL